MQTLLDRKMNIDKRGWSLVRLGDVVFEPKESVKDPADEGIERVVGLEHIDSEDIHLRRFAGIEEETTFTKKFLPGDILFGRRRAYLKKAAQAEFKGICSGDITVMRANEKLSSKLLPFIINNDKFFDHAITHSAGGLSPRVKFKDLANYEFLLPPKEQQAEIAELLWAMDEVVVTDNNSISKTKELYLSKIEKQLLNENSSKINFSALGEIIRGVGYKPEDLLDMYELGTCLILRANNIFESLINFNDVKIVPLKKVKETQLLKYYDFAICMSNGSKELVGKSAQFFSHDKNVSVGSFCAIFRPKDKFSAYLSRHLFASNSYRQLIKRTLSGSAINNLKPSDIENLFLRVNQNNDKKLMNLLDELNGLLERKKEMNKTCIASKNLQKSLINEVF